MDIQALFDGLSARWQQERAATQMTLGGMLAALESMPADTLVDGFTNPHSYRGYYTDLAFEPVDGKVTVAEALALCRSAMGEVFTGYKGGEYCMGKLTPVWLSYYGTCGPKIMGIDDTGTIVTEEDD